MLFGDGSVKFVKSSIGYQTWWALGTRNGGEVISARRLLSVRPGGRPRRGPRPATRRAAIWQNPKKATPEIENSGGVFSVRQEEAKVGRRAWALLVGVMAAGGGFWAFEVWQLRAEWRQAKHDVAKGKPASALTRLTRLARHWPEDGEVLYDLGACELTLGHEDRAVAAWARIPPNSPFAPRASMMRARLC